LTLVLTGFMGAGKTTAARIAADKLGLRTVDADAAFEQRYGPVPRFFEEHGEAEFRAREEALTLELLDRGGLLALGGGAILSERIRAALARPEHTVMLLEVDALTAWERSARSDRPLARDRGAFDERYAARARLYEQVADVVLPQGAAVAPAVADLDAFPGQGARMTWGLGGGKQYPVLVGAGVRDAPLGPPGRAFTVADAALAALAGGDPATTTTVPGGEATKTLAHAERLWHWLAAAGATRGDHVRAVGGGVVGDLAGFVAATYQRGVPVVHVPTTVVAQVDSSLGGKTGVDLPEAKNYVGAYHQPAAVLADVDVLATLPPAEHAAGFAEVVKTALIAGGELWERIAGGAPVDAGVVFACARTKLRVVAQDERDGGVRQVLNLGHTVGHALETVTGYTALRHGEAVGLGLLAALRLSGQAALRDQVAELLAARGLPTALDGVGVAPDAVVAATRRDKKRTGDEVPFVLVDAPGAVRHGALVPDGELRAAVRELLAA
jgi:shikimate kinase/3-dehydroquinate synthase